MSKYLPKYRPVHRGVSIVDKDAYTDYRLSSTVRDPKKFKDYTDYRRIVRKIWKRIADYSIEYNSGVYAKNFFYLIPQVVDNRPFIEMGNGKIRTNSHTNGDVYTPIFCNLFNRFDQVCWSLDGTYVKSYTEKLSNKIDEFVPKYYFILSTLIKNKF